MLVTQRDGSLHEKVSGRAAMGDQRTFGALQRAGDALLGETQMTWRARSGRAEMPIRGVLVRAPAVAVVGVARMSAQLGRLGPTSPSTGTGDTATQLLLVADGTAGLSIVDLSVPGGQRDEDGDGVDDRVIGTVELSGARASQVTLYRNRLDGLIAVVASGSGGVDIIQVLPNSASSPHRALLRFGGSGGGGAQVAGQCEAGVQVEFDLVSPTVLRDDLTEVRISLVPPQPRSYTFQLSVTPDAMRQQTLGARGAVQMYDFGVSVSGAVRSVDKITVTPADDQKTFFAIFNKEGDLRIKATSVDGAIQGESPKINVEKQIRKYAASSGYGLNMFDQHFESSALYWGGVYQHPVDSELLKAICMTESDMGINAPNDVMSLKLDGALPILRGTSAAPESEVDISGNAIRPLAYASASEVPASAGIHWATAWLYHKAQTIKANPSPPPAHVPGPWKSWDQATIAYNGGGVGDYLIRVKRCLEQGRHPTTPGRSVWPRTTDGKARP